MTKQISDLQRYIPNLTWKFAVCAAAFTGFAGLQYGQEIEKTNKLDSIHRAAQAAFDNALDAPTWLLPPSSYNNFRPIYDVSISLSTLSSADIYKPGETIRYNFESMTKTTAKGNESLLYAYPYAPIDIGDYNDLKNIFGKACPMARNFKEIHPSYLYYDAEENPSSYEHPAEVTKVASDYFYQHRGRSDEQHVPLIYVQARGGDFYDNVCNSRRIRNALSEMKVTNY